MSSYSMYSTGISATSAHQPQTPRAVYLLAELVHRGQRDLRCSGALPSQPYDMIRAGPGHSSFPRSTFCWPLRC
jgi:hypothetical protein